MAKHKKARSHYDHRYRIKQNNNLQPASSTTSHSQHYPPPVKTPQQQQRGKKIERGDSGSGSGVVATLDLHGCRREKALSDATSFLSYHRRAVDVARQERIKTRSIHRDDDDNNEAKFNSRAIGTTSAVWVRIITGTGIHSPQGPVLKRAIQSSLDKRNMHYILERSRGSFLVDATSGHDLYSDPNLHQPLDTKVILTDDSQVMSLSSSSADCLPNMTERRQQQRLRNNNNLQTSLLDPTPREAAREESDFHRALEASRVDASRCQSRQDREHNVFRRALSISLEEEFHREEEMERRLREDVDKAMELSQLEEEELKNQYGDDALQRALSVSLQDSQREKEDDDNNLERAMKESMQFCEQHPRRFMEEDDDEMLMGQVMRWSLDAS